MSAFDPYQAHQTDDPRIDFEIVDFTVCQNWNGQGCDGNPRAKITLRIPENNRRAILNWQLDAGDRNMKRRTIIKNQLAGGGERTFYLSANKWGKPLIDEYEIDLGDSMTTAATARISHEGTVLDSARVSPITITNNLSTNDYLNVSGCKFPDTAEVGETVTGEMRASNNYWKPLTVGENWYKAYNRIIARNDSYTLQPGEKRWFSGTGEIPYIDLCIYAQDRNESQRIGWSAQIAGGDLDDVEGTLCGAFECGNPGGGGTPAVFDPADVTLANCSYNEEPTVVAEGPEVGATIQNANAQAANVTVEFVATPVGGGSGTVIGQWTGQVNAGGNPAVFATADLSVLGAGEYNIEATITNATEA